MHASNIRARKLLDVLTMKDSADRIMEKIGAKT